MITIVNVVCDLISQRDAYRAAQARIWSLPGAPLIGIVSAEDSARWEALGIRADHIAAQINEAREVLESRSAPTAEEAG